VTTPESSWNFLTNHALVLLCIARNPEIRLREIATILGISERRAYAIVTELTDDGYLVKCKEGRRNRYEIQTQLPLPEFTDRDQAIGAILHLLVAPRERRRHVRRADDWSDRATAAP
jgi:hypothetical protein